MKDEGGGMKDEKGSKDNSKPARVPFFILPP
jgi:hypothetical protein